MCVRERESDRTCSRQGMAGREAGCQLPRHRGSAASASAASDCPQPINRGGKPSVLLRRLRCSGLVRGVGGGRLQAGVGRVGRWNSLLLHAWVLRPTSCPAQMLLLVRVFMASLTR